MPRDQDSQPLDHNELATEAVERWEHCIERLTADAAEQRTFLEREWPGRRFPRYAPEALIPLLDRYGKEGWELVALQPVALGVNGDVLVAGSPTTGECWTREYLATFKRRKQDW
jgi:hypothetical protein